MLRMLPALVLADFSTLSSYLRKSGIFSGFLRTPPLATGFALILRVPEGQREAWRSLLIRPSLPKSRSGS